MFMTIYLILAILFIVAVLLQQKNASLGSMMGGGGDEIVATRRGADSFLHMASIFLSVLLIIGGLLVMYKPDLLA